MRISALVVHHAERKPARIGSGDKFAYFFSINTDRFFRDDRNPALECLDSDYRMIIMRSGDNDGVAQPAVKQRSVIIEKSDLAFYVGAHPIEPRWLDVAYRCERRALDFAAPKPADMTSTHITDADNTETNLIHCNVLLLTVYLTDIFYIKAQHIASDINIFTNKK